VTEKSKENRRGKREEERRKVVQIEDFVPNNN
jgi:hypothetical protein